MNNRKYKTSPEKLLDEGKKILSETRQSRYYFKICAVNMVLSGCKASYIASMSGVSRMSVSSWVKIADEKGFEALKSEGHSGRPGKLSSVQREMIDKALQCPPGDYGFKVWDGPCLAAFISKKFCVSMSVRQCQRLMHSLGYSLIRPQSFPSKGYEDTKAREDFKKNARKSRAIRH